MSVLRIAFAPSILVLDLSQQSSPLRIRTDDRAARLVLDLLPFIAEGATASAVP